MRRLNAVLLASAGVLTVVFVAPRLLVTESRKANLPGAEAEQPAASTTVSTSLGPEILVYKSPTCGCCKKWNDYLTSNGYTVKSRDMDDVSPMKAELGVPRKLVSCHTAVVQGYVIEGHVPAADIARLLEEKPKIVGLTAPGMPGASPGMDTGSDPYEVLTFDAKGATTVWARH
jgi:hypothetical protein